MRQAAGNGLEGVKRMQSVEQKHGQTIFFEKIGIETVEAMSCSQIREKLDGLFDEGVSLEDTSQDIKCHLFAHLETCRACCRAFDVRVRFRSNGRARIY